MLGGSKKKDRVVLGSKKAGDGEKPTHSYTRGRLGVAHLGLTLASAGF
jgi:hypothetical protein